MTSSENGHMKVAKIDGVKLAEFYKEADAIIARHKELKK